MEDIQARLYDKAGGYVSEITFNNGQKLEIKRNDIIIFVGPNNVGKSQSLRDIYEISGEARAHIVISDVKFEKSNDDIQTLLERVAFKTPESGYIHYDVLGKSYNYASYSMNNFMTNDGLRDFRDLFMVFLDTSSRLYICNAPPLINRGQPQNHPIQYAAFNREKRKWLTKNFYKAFGQKIIPNTNYGGSIQTRNRSYCYKYV